MFIPGCIFRAIWSVLSVILRFTGRLVAIILGAIFVVVGVIFTISIAGYIWYSSDNIWYTLDYKGLF